MTLEEFKEKHDLIPLNGLEDKGIYIDLKYATPNNFTNMIVYPDTICLFRKEAYIDLLKALKEFKRLGYGLLVWDAFRSQKVQEKFFEIYPDPTFVADPKIGSTHTTGGAIDLTLVKLDPNKGYQLIPMPTEFDDFTEKAASNYSEISEEKRKNRELFHKVMFLNNFTPLESEWWHLIHKKNYPLIKEDYEREFNDSVQGKCKKIGKI